METEFSLPVRVYIEDTDAGGIVFYPNYLKYMERARTELLRQFGIPKPATLDGGMLLVVASVNVVYKKSARLDDLLKVTAQLVKIARSYVVFSQQVVCDDELLCQAEVKVACVDRESMKPKPFPGKIRDLLSS